MDNIDEEVQLHAIAGSHDWFGPGSRIIITTRDECLLQNVNKVYPLQEMNEDEALELFSWHAFGNRWPNGEYLELSKNVVSYCGGLPLALEVLGSFLFKRTIVEWESQLEKLKRTPEGKIIKPLRISFEGLDDAQKAIFLDISCFFIGKDKDYVTKVLDGCGFFASIGISVLRERCLVTVEDNKLNMHDLLREMARVVISQKSPSHPEKWSRLWNRQEVIDVLTNESGTRKIEGLALHFPYPPLSSTCQNEETKIASFSTKAFAKMKKLRLLQLSNVELKGEYKHLPKKLIWLFWEECPLKSIPDDLFNQPRLVVLEMRYSKLVQVWEGSKSLHNLKTLDLSYSHCLEKSPDFSQVPNLEELILEKCESLSEIHPSVGHLKRLYLVNLSHCFKLISLPRDFYKSKSIETLLLNYCFEFRELHEDIGEMISLRTLEAEHTAIREVPPSIGHLKRLALVNLSRCFKLISLPRDFYKLKSVETLLLNYCSEFRELHEDIGEMISLRTLEADYTHIREVPLSIVGLKNLTCLSLERISVELNQDKLVVLEMQRSELVQVWEGSESLHNLKTLDLSFSDFSKKSLDFSQVPNLEELILENCRSLSEIHPSIGHLKRLSLVNLKGCRMLSSLPRNFYKLKSVETLLLDYCSEFIELHEDVGEMISLRILDADYTAIRQVPPSILRLKNLTRLSLRGVQLADDAIPKDLGSLICLQVLDLSENNFHSLPSLNGLSKLETLRLDKCFNLHKIPDLPTNLLHGLNSLRELDLSCCRLADNEIPKDLGSLISLQVLDLSRNDFHTLPSLSGLSKLETLRLDGCFNLRRIPDIPPNVKVQHE